MNKLSTNFLLMNDHNQQTLLINLSKDFRNKNLFNHLSHLYSLKKNFIKENKYNQSRILNPRINFTPQNTTNNYTPSTNSNITNQQQIIIQRPSSKIERENASKNIIDFNPPKPNIPEKTYTVNPQKQLNQIIEKHETISFSKYMKKFLVHEKLKSLTHHKNVALIGPSQYLSHTNQAESINNYDIIIRFNSSIIIPSHMTQHVGNRTDIWIYNFKDPSLLQKLPNKLPKLIFCPYPKETIDSYNLSQEMPQCPIEFIDGQFFQNLQSAMKIEPNSALISILTLLRQSLSSLYISGISFLYDGYYDNPQKNESINKGTQLITTDLRNNFIGIIKKVFNANEKLFIDNTMLNLIYPNFMTIVNKLFIKENYNKLFSTLNYHLFIPSFQLKYNEPNTSSKIFVHFGKKPIQTNLQDKMHLIIHSIKPNLFHNEVFIKNEECNYDDLEYLLQVKNKGIIYFSNNQWNAIDNMIPKKNRDYILSHHCYVNGNIYGSFIKYITKDFDINEDNKNINMLYMLFSIVFYGQKIVYVSKENVYENGLLEIVNVMKKLNLIKYLS